MKRSPFQTALLVVLAAHLIWVIGRIPHSVVGKRLQQIDDYRTRGDARHFLDGEFLHGAAAITWIRDHVAEDHVVLWDGDHRESFEFAPLLLFPRPLVDLRAVEADQLFYGGRPIATGSIDGHQGRIVLVGKGKDLGIEVR